MKFINLPGGLDVVGIRHSKNNNNMVLKIKQKQTKIKTRTNKTVNFYISYKMLTFTLREDKNDTKFKTTISAQYNMYVTFVNENIYCDDFYSNIEVLKMLIKHTKTASKEVHYENGFIGNFLIIFCRNTNDANLQSYYFMELIKHISRHVKCTKLRVVNDLKYIQTNIKKSKI